MTKRDELVERKAEPVAWRCKDYADGWILYDSELRARDYKVKTGCLMQPLYSTPPARDAKIEALEKENATLKAGIKRLSDEEEFINETGRDGMLSAVHIGARLAEAEELARAMEAEANQLREVSISHRNRAEALEESLKTVLASLVATTSLIIRAEDLKVKPSKAVASDKMFTQMLKDYDKATIAGRAALSLPENEEDRSNA